MLIDATVVHLLLVPATMNILGPACWWQPRWLDRLLPHLDTEGAEPTWRVSVGPGAPAAKAPAAP